MKQIVIAVWVVLALALASAPGLALAQAPEPASPQEDESVPEPGVEESSEAEEEPADEEPAIDEPVLEEEVDRLRELLGSEETARVLRWVRDAVEGAEDFRPFLDKFAQRARERAIVIADLEARHHLSLFANNIAEVHPKSGRIRLREGQRWDIFSMPLFAFLEHYYRRVDGRLVLRDEADLPQIYRALRRVASGEGLPMRGGDPEELKRRFMIAAAHSFARIDKDSGVVVRQEGQDWGLLDPVVDLAVSYGLEPGADGRLAPRAEFLQYWKAAGRLVERWMSGARAGAGAAKDGKRKKDGQD